MKYSPKVEWIVEYTDPDVPGTSTKSVMATSAHQAEILGNVWYYGETKPTVTPKHPVRIWRVN